MTQAELGAYFSVTFQQIQKHEKGINGISAADLARVRENNFHSVRS
ncbi:hypothetical protein [Bradyrhizobium sp. 14AA]